ncbi:hypothetical protein [Streptomyces sp. NPDC047043]|uniref:hypothetical protein n=1 Tax=Streptomyces sp. NPDC047043 TaxID=3154497 RepID=UPI0033C755B5
MSPYGCRQERLGWYCRATGLVFDAEAIVYPTHDPIGKHEQAVIDEYGPHLAQAEALTDAALEQFSSAQSAHLDLLYKCTREGVTAPGMGTMIGVPVDHTAARFNSSNGRMVHRLSDLERRTLVDAEKEARDLVEVAEERLNRERKNLSGLERRFEAAQVAARSQDRENRR